MKKTTRLTENELKHLIKESVKRILNESCWYGDTKPFEQILDAASKICEEFKYTQDENWEPWDDCDGRDLSYDIYSWAEKVMNEAENWIHYNSSNTPINGGEDW